jgi:hypothetical protein
MAGRIDVTRGRRRRRKQILDIKEKRGYWKLKEEAVDCPHGGNRFGRGCGPVLRQTAGGIIC